MISEYFCATNLIYFSSQYINYKYPKYPAKDKESMHNLTRQENMDICFCVSFDYYCPKMMSAGDIGHCAVSLTNFKTLLLFPTLQKSQVKSCTAIRETNRLKSLLYLKSRAVSLGANQTCAKT